MRTQLFFAVCVAVSTNLVFRESPVPDSSRAIAPPTTAEEKPKNYAGLHNVVAYHDGYYSGSVPEGDAGFDTLSGMGVRTIISVDGAAPDIASAKARGIRYIHLPIGYNGFDERRKLELVRATRDALKEGPVYIHCHHGKHRSAGAAGTVVASLGWASPEQMTARMRVSGTSASYRGLYSCTADAKVLSGDMIDALQADFPEVSHPQGMVRIMVEVDEVHEHLKLIESAGWRSPADHPDLVPAAEAGRVADLFRVLSEGNEVQGRPADFAAMMIENGSHAKALEDLLAAGEKDHVKLSERMKLVTNSCKDCHVKFRD